MKRIPLAWQIIIGLVLGVAWGVIANQIGWQQFTLDYIKPIGTIFIRLLKLIAIPLIVASLILGVSSLNDIKKLGKIGGKTILFYMISTAVAVTIGLLAVNIVQPGALISAETRTELQAQYGGEVTTKITDVEKQREKGPLDALVNIVPENIFGAMSDNAGMLQVVFFALFFGIVLILIPDEKSAPLIHFFDGVNEAIMKMIELIMYTAPYAVFALLAALMAEFASVDLLKALGAYSLTVLAGLALMVFAVYPLALKFLGGVEYRKFLRGIFPAQILAFSTSSSAATLPVTMKQVEDELGVSEEVSSFVLPLGATINMDGTSLYQGVAAVFIAQAFAIDLSVGQMLTIVLTATLASIGAAGVPGAGMVMLVIVLQSIGIDPVGIALIVAMDRPLDMCRTVVNVTGDATVASLIASTENKIDLETANS